MAKRWAGPVLTHAAARSLAGKYAEQLRLLHSRCESDPHVFIDVLGYSSGMVQGTPSSPFFPSAAQQPVHRSQAGNVNYENHTTGPEPLSVGGPAPDIQPGPSGMDPIQPPIQQSGLTPSADIHPDKLSAISHMLMEEDFMAMDRIISLDDMIFTAPEISSSALTWGNGNGQVE